MLFLVDYLLQQFMGSAYHNTYMMGILVRSDKMSLSISMFDYFAL